MASVYFIQNTKNHKLYVGVTAGSIEDRWNKHVNKAKNGSKFKFHCAIRKYGAESFFWVEAARFDLLADAYEREEILIRLLDARISGYNTAHGGSDGVRKEITIHGVTYPSCNAAAKAFGVPYQRMMNRINAKGMTPEQAVTPDVIPKTRWGSIEVGGRKYDSISAAARELNLCHVNVAKRIKNLGWTINQALEIEPRPPRTRKSKK